MQRVIKSSKGHSIYIGKYIHYKGNTYNVIGLCKHTETAEELVYYQALYGNYEFWARPIEMFVSDIDFEGKIVPRFSFIE